MYFVLLLVKLLIPYCETPTLITRYPPPPTCPFPISVNTGIRVPTHFGGNANIYFVTLLSTLTRVTFFLSFPTDSNLYISSRCQLHGYQDGGVEFTARTSRYKGHRLSTP